MKSTKETTINGQRVTISVLLVLLLFACVFQGSFTGCANTSDEPTVADETTMADSGGHVVERSNNPGQPEPARWEPVSDGVMTQILVMYQDSPVSLVSMETDANSSESMKAVFEYRNGVSYQKQFLDGFTVFADTFPQQDHYVVGLTDGSSAEAEWDNLEMLEDFGYTLESTDRDAEIIWRMVMGGAEVPGAKSSGGTSVQTEG